MTPGCSLGIEGDQAGSGVTFGGGRPCEKLEKRVGWTGKLDLLCNLAISRGDGAFTVERRKQRVLLLPSRPH